VAIWSGKSNVLATAKVEISSIGNIVFPRRAAGEAIFESGVDINAGSLFGS